MKSQPTKHQALKVGWFHRYPARFSADVLGGMLDSVVARLGRKPRLLLDPFAGTGATLTAARQKGIPAVGIELTPLGHLIAKVRLNPPKDLDRALALAEEMASAAPPRNADGVSAELIDWIGTTNGAALSICLKTIERQTDSRTRDWLRLAVSSALRPASCWLPGSIKAQRDPSRTPPALGPNLIRSARALYRDCLLENEDASTTAHARIVRGDSRDLPLEDASVDAVVTSPPYWIMYDYFDVHRLSYLAFGWPQQEDLQIGRKYGISMDGAGFIAPAPLKTWYLRDFEAEGTVLGRSLRDYVQSMRDHMAEIARVVRPGGVIAYAVADSTRSGRHFRLVSALQAIIEESGFRNVVAVTRRTSHRRILPAGRDVSTGRFDSSASGKCVREQVLYAKRF